MKTKEEIIIWASDKDFSDSTNSMIKGYLLANGIDDLNFYSANRFRECSFEEFVEWFNRKDDIKPMSQETADSLVDIIARTHSLCNTMFGKMIDCGISPKFKPYDKVVITNEHPQYTWEIKDVKFHERTDKSKKGHFRYLLSRDGAEQWVKESKIELFMEVEEKEEPLYIKWLNSSPKTKFSKGDKVIQNTNIQNMDRVFTIQQVKQEYYGNDWHTKYILDDGRIIKESKLSAYEGEQRNVKIGDWLRCTTTNKVFKLYAVDYSESLRCFVVGDKDAFVTHTFEPYSPKEGEFTLVQLDDNADGGRSAILNVKKWGDLVYDIASIFIKDNVCFCNSSSEFALLGNIYFFRPATEEEKQTLIKAVEDKYNKTYCEKTKDWIEVSREIVHNSNTDAFERELGALVNRYSLESFFGNKPDYQIAREMVEYSTKIGEIGGNNDRIKQIEKADEIIIERANNEMFNIIVGDYIGDCLSWDEMLGTLAAITLESDIKDRKCVHWLKTKDQHLQGGAMSLQLKDRFGILTDDERVIYEQTKKL